MHFITTRYPQVDPGWFKRWLEPPPYVPWGVGKIVQVMILWLLAYIIIGQVRGDTCIW